MMYRLISLTSVVCKIMETIIRDNMMKFFEDYVNNWQHGFRSKGSLLTNLLDLFHYIPDVYDQSKSVDIIYLNFQKTFDKISHERLLNQQTTDALYLWLTFTIGFRIGSWRGNRDGLKGCFVQLSKCTPGFGIWPVFFLIYVNDVDEEIFCRISKFSDDTKSSIKVTTTHDSETLKSDLDRFICWANEWQMELNVDKCTIVNEMTKQFQDNLYKILDKWSLTFLL